MNRNPNLDVTPQPQIVSASAHEVPREPPGPRADRNRHQQQPWRGGASVPGGRAKEEERIAGRRERPDLVYLREVASQLRDDEDEEDEAHIRLVHGVQEVGVWKGVRQQGAEGAVQVGRAGAQEGGEGGWEMHFREEMPIQ